MVIWQIQHYLLQPFRVTKGEGRLTACRHDQLKSQCTVNLATQHLQRTTAQLQRVPERGLLAPAELAQHVHIVVP